MSLNVGNITDRCTVDASSPRSTVMLTKVMELLSCLNTMFVQVCERITHCNNIVLLGFLSKCLCVGTKPLEEKVLVNKRADAFFQFESL